MENFKNGLKDVSLKHRVGLFILITLGVESVLYFADWWLDASHRKSTVFYIALTFALFYGLYRSLVNWFYFMFIKGQRHITPKEGLSVDVFTTAMPGEPYDMFVKTLTAFTKISYPHNSYLLDGGNDPELMALCEKLGIHHINCKDIPGAKAGKINDALSRTEAEFVMVIDPDHIPEPQFLDRVLGHFSDNEVGFVQVVQAYYNQGESFIARAGAEQAYGFYGPTMMGMNGLGTAVAIGANCTFRRSALKSIGGHAVDLAEDLVTSMKLHAQGWKSVYVPERVSFGLNPADLHSYFKQQLKWSTGMFNAFYSHYFKYFFHFKLGQKLHYLFAGLFYLEGLAVAITCILPIVFLFFGLWAVEMELPAFLLHLSPYLFMSMIIAWYTQLWFRHPSEKGFPWRGMFLGRGTWPIYLLSLAYFITRTKVPYLPTPKTAEKKRFTALVLPHITVALLSLAAILYALLTYNRMEAGTQLMIFFAALNIVLMAPTIFAAHFPDWGSKSNWENA